MKRIEALSPNFENKKRAKQDIKFIIIHYTGMQSMIESIERLQDKKAKVSCHYLIDRKGRIILMVPENKVAWHAGKSKWKKFNNLNLNSIGIELVNKGHKFGYQNFSSLQIKRLIYLCKKLKKKYKIKEENFLGHSDIAPLRKIDPGEKFPWEKLSNFGLGIWYKFKDDFFKISKNSQKKNFFKNIHKIGYRYFNKNLRNQKNDRLLIKAFQRRYLPNQVTGNIDYKTYKISHFLANSKKFS